MELGEFQTLVNPHAHIPAFISVLTGITDAMVAEAPAIGQVLPSFLEFARGSVLVAHNAACPHEDESLEQRFSSRNLSGSAGDFGISSRCQLPSSNRAPTKNTSSPRSPPCSPPAPPPTTGRCTTPRPPSTCCTSSSVASATRASTPSTSC